MAIRVALAIRNSNERAEPYRLALHQAGLEAVTFAPDSPESPDTVAGLLLAGGSDVDPRLYSATPQPETQQPDRERDLYESALLREMLARDLPVLAICRGSQLFNVVCGGTLIQHLPNTPRHQQQSGGVPVHEVALEGRIAKILGARTLSVNSRHHQASDCLGAGLVVTARDPEDGVIESFELPSARFAVGVQWHPEDMTADERQARFFTAFADAAGQNGR